VLLLTILLLLLGRLPGAVGVCAVAAGTHRCCLLLLRLRALCMLTVPPQLCDQPVLELWREVGRKLLDEFVSRHVELLADLVDLRHSKALQTM
jgi:hypothetical protein